MIIIILSTLIISISSSILLTISPLSIGITILIIAVTLSIIFASIISSWVAFLIFLIYVRGILVIFAYFVSLIPNQSTNITSFYLPLAIIRILIITTQESAYINNYTQIIKYINTFYSINNTPILIILALALLLAIIVVVKIVINNKGPLRPFINYV